MENGWRLGPPKWTVVFEWTPRRCGRRASPFTEYGKVTVTWWTHKIGGLHRNDFISAGKTDALMGPAS